MKNFLTVIFTFVSLFAASQYPPVDLPGSEKRKFASKIVGQEYELHIQATGVTNEPGKKYPVIYLLDSQWDFPLVRSVIGQQFYDGFIPAVILVGITWGGEHPNHDSLRVRDFTPTNEAPFLQSGSARKFLSFIKEELIPYMESEFSTDKNNRVLMGCSFGGLFTMYSLFEEPGLFQSYIAASPAYDWDKQRLYSFEKKYFDKKNHPGTKLYMTIGDVEPGVPGYNKLFQHLQSRKYSNISMRSFVLENTGHSGTKSETYSKGLQFAFERPQLMLPKEDLKKYTGIYKSENNKNASIHVKGDQLELLLSPGNSYLLYAESENSFYSKAEFFKVKFGIENNKVSTMSLQTYSSTEILRKTQ